MKGCRYFKDGWCCFLWKYGQVFCAVVDKKSCNKEREETKSLKRTKTERKRKVRRKQR